MNEEYKQKKWRNGERGLNLNIRPGERIVLKDGIEITNCSLSHRVNMYWSELFGHELSDVSHAAFFCARKFS